jgi:hypothetical protein
MYEYMAAGKPIVSTDVLEARGMDPLVRIAKSQSEFVERIEESFIEDRIVNARRRVEYAFTNSWEMRVSEIESELDFLIIAAIKSKSPDHGLP